ncbi:YtxH domain-containing protein [Bacillus chungangensis]|uniref:Gas vesicle protein n=1 Tax=Bacillus chungangensis TaxID=587633 RepID=A0ABT9WU82_9BACI|nr:YtxH domain-containing protein [Bacillus chungangensis]MDQ0176859.1 gas vesicle protein [Bacillus chungangensis]
MANNESKNNQNNQIDTKDFLIGALVGGIVGAATALLLAPKSGKELRSDINEQVSNLKEKTDHWKDAAVEKSSEMAAAAKEKTTQLKDTAVEKGNQFAGTVKEKTEKIRDVAVEKSHDLKEKAAKLQKNIQFKSTEKAENVQIKAEEEHDVQEKLKEVQTVNDQA